MKTENKNLNEADSIALSVAIGYEVSRLLSLKFDKAGRTKTSWGTKSIEGLGKCIQVIVEDQSQRLRSDATKRY
jgi:hypothetical protein